jgi:hypothetical protein
MSTPFTFFKRFVLASEKQVNRF